MTARRPLVAGVAIAVGLAVAACGSSHSDVAAVGTSPAATSGGASTTTPGSAPDRQAIQQCLAQKGFNLPQGGFRGGGGPPTSGSAPTGSAPAGGANQAQPPTSRPPIDPQLQQALRDCGAGTGFGRGGGGGAGFNDPALRQCLADRGVTLPPPGAGSAPSTPPSSASANLRQAMQACRAQLAPTTTSPPPTG